MSLSRTSLKSSLRISGSSMTAGSQHTVSPFSCDGSKRGWWQTSDINYRNQTTKVTPPPPPNTILTPQTNPLKNNNHACWDGHASFCIVTLHFDVTLLYACLCLCIGNVFMVKVVYWALNDILFICYVGSGGTLVKCWPQTELTDSTRLISLLANTHTRTHVCSYGYVSHTIEYSSWCFPIVMMVINKLLYCKELYAYLG